jgi:uncharacterized damage-inducible protein DinB
MTKEIARLELQLRRSFEGEAWSGPSLLEALANVTDDQARARPVAQAHTIWELVLHLIGTYNLVLRRMRGDAAPLSPEEDWPPVPPDTLSPWHDTVGRLRDLNEQLCRQIREFRAEDLDNPLVNGTSSAYTQFIGVTQHNLYHAGQIVLLAKATPDQA